MDLLSTISLEVNNNGTIFLTHYSVVYDLVTGDMEIVTDRAYNQIYHYKLEMKK